MQIVKKNAKGYGYNYADLSGITKLIDELDISYYQYIDPVITGESINEYVMTVIEYKDGTKSDPIRGARVVKTTLNGKQNPVQAYGASLTYARRYSLLMAFGLATSDDDGECFTDSNTCEVQPNYLPKKGDENKQAYEQQINQLEGLCKKYKVPPVWICNMYKIESVEQLTVCNAFNLISKWESIVEHYEKELEENSPLN